MQKRIVNLAFGLWLLSGVCIAQGYPVPVPQVRNFTKEVYGALSQNWCITQDLAGTIFVANSKGLLEYDGSTWTLYPSPNGNIIRAVAADRDGRIYTSGYQEIGYWTRNKDGKLAYTSLNEKAAEWFIQNVEFWNIYILEDKVLFTSFTQMMIYENGRIRPFNFHGFTNSLTVTDGRIFMNIMNRGIFELRDTVAVPFLTGDFFNSKIIRFFLPAGPGKFLIGTASDGIFLVTGESISLWPCPENGYFRANQINRGVRLPSGDLLVGTILDGITLLDSTGQFKWRINTRNGLQNNTVLGLLSDQENNLWVALDRGIDFVETGNWSGVHFFPAQQSGAVYTASLFEGMLYLGTNQGLFAAPSDQGPWVLVEGTQGQVWDLTIVGDQLIAGHNSGTFAVKNGKARQISNVSGGFCIRPDPFDPGSYVQCSYSNLVKYTLFNGTLNQSMVIYNFNELIRFLEFDHLDNLWAGHMYRGIYRLKFNRERDSVRIAGYYGLNSAFHKDHQIHVFNLENRVVFTTGEQIFAYDGLQDTILPFTQLNHQLGPYARAIRIIPAGNHFYWFVAPDNIGLLKIEETKVTMVRNFPAEVFRNQLISDYVNILPLGDREGIICLENGFARLNAGVEGIRSTLADKTPVLRSVYLINSAGEQFVLPIDSRKLVIPWEKNSLHLQVAVSHFSTNVIRYQWMMEGLRNEWSEKTESPVISFERIPAGRYLLRVRAADPWENQSRDFTIPVVVRPPWYLTTAARILYVITFAFILLLFRRRVVQNTRKKEQRQSEEKERELITLKNQKLQDDISFKSKQLANSTMAIIKKNEFLLDLKESLLQQKTNLGSRYPEKYLSDLTKKIDASLASQDDWKVFETSFEQAHELFLHKIKDTYPELTSTDLRLCAFLRMNLSSKEIAPLLGISVRGVENHRYRLRKKMNLEHDRKLIDMILEL